MQIKLLQFIEQSEIIKKDYSVQINWAAKCPSETKELEQERKNGPEEESLLILNDFLKDINIPANCGKSPELLM